MKEEINSAAEFLGKLLKMGCPELSRKQIDAFCFRMESLLMEHFQNHWFPQKPYKGSGYRCLRINHKMDPIIARGAETCGLRHSELSSVFPNELTLWIDPREVSYRIGENGSICVLFDADESSSAESGSSSGDSDLESPPQKPSPTTNRQYMHPFPTPPSSPPTVQGFHNNQHHQQRVPMSNNSCRKDLSSYWGPTDVTDCVRSVPMMQHMEHIVPYVSS